MFASDQARYTKVAIALHWLIALLVIAQVGWGWWMQEIPKQPVGPRVDAYNLHKSCGMMIFALMVARLGWRLGHPPPPLPALPGWQRTLANGTHALIYAALFVLPLSGYLGSAWSGYPVKFFGVTLPAWAAKSDPLKDLMSRVHLVTGFVLVTAFALHLAGVVKHTLEGRREILGRMSPFKA